MHYIPIFSMCIVQIIFSFLHTHPTVSNISILGQVNCSIEAMRRPDSVVLSVVQVQ